MAKTKKQLAIAGTEAKGIKEVETAAESYVEVRDERMALTEKEVDARDTLIRVMEKHKLEIYRDENADPPLIITLEPGVAKVKVKRETDEVGGEQ